MRWIASSARTPITESCGPVMPASVIAAVPPGRTRASFVCTCVCVPSTAVTRPSSMRASAIFSLVASAWKSTRTTGVCARASSTSASTTRNGWIGVGRKSWPWRLSTATAVPSPGLCDGQAPTRNPHVAEVRGPEHARVGLEHRHEVAVPPDVVPGRDHVGARLEDPHRELRREPDAVRGVLAVHDAEVDVELVLELGQAVGHRPPAGRAEHVADEEELQRTGPI